MNKTLITGGLGYIGSHIAYHLKNEAVILDNQLNSNLNYKKLLPMATVVIGDCNFKNVSRIFKKFEIEKVIHLAGYKAVNESIKSPIEYYQNNFYSSLDLIRAMDDFKITNLIFSSSATVYGNKNQSPFNEESLLESLNPYASTKIAIEQLIRDYSKSKKNFKSFILRYFNPIGANLKSGLSDQPLGKPLNLMPVLIESVINKKTFEIFGSNYSTKDGTCIRDYIHVDDLALAHLKALKCINKIKGSVELNVGMGNGLSVLEFIKIFQRTNNIKIKFKFGKKREGDCAESYASIKKAKKILGWKPKKSYENMMFDSWNAYLNRKKI